LKRANLEGDLGEDWDSLGLSLELGDIDVDDDGGVVLLVITAAAAAMVLHCSFGLSKGDDEVAEERWHLGVEDAENLGVEGLLLLPPENIPPMPTQLLLLLGLCCCFFFSNIFDDVDDDDVASRSRRIDVQNARCHPDSIPTQPPLPLRVHPPFFSLSFSLFLLFFFSSRSLSLRLYLLVSPSLSLLS